MLRIKNYDHVAIAVNSIEESLKLYKDILGGKVIAERQLGYDGSIYWVQVLLGGAKIELIEPRTSGSSLARFLDKHGEGLHHISLRVENIEEAIAHLERNGIRVVDKYLDDPKFKTAFISPRNVSHVLIQVYESYEED